MVNPYFHMFGLKAGSSPRVAAGATMLPEPVFDVDRVAGPGGRRSGSPCCPARRRSTSRSSTTPTATDHDLSTPAGRGHRRGRHPRRAHPPHRRRAAVLDDHHRLRAHRGRHGGGHRRPDDDPETIATTVGRPRPGFELRIVDGELQDVPAGEAGEILLRGGSIMSHYLDDPEATAAALSRRRLAAHRRPRRASTSAGCLRIVGRSKDMFIVGGFNAYPAEIENALLRHPDVQQAAVIGVPDERLGEVGMAFVVAAPGADADRRRDHRRGAATQMANYKVPRRGRARRRAPGQRHRQGREGRAAGAGRLTDRPATGTGHGADGGMREQEDLRRGPRPASPIEVGGRDAVVHVGHLDRLDALVAELADRAGSPRCPRTLGPGSFSTMKPEMPSSVRAASATSAGPLAVGDPGLRAVDDVLVAVERGLAAQMLRVSLPASGSDSD